MSDFGQRLRDAIDHLKHRHSTGDPLDFGPVDMLVSEANGGGVQPSASAPETVTPAPAPASVPAAPEPAASPAADEQPSPSPAE